MIKQAATFRAAVEINGWPLDAESKRDAVS